MVVRNEFESIEHEAVLLTDNINYKERRIKARKIQFDKSRTNDVRLVGTRIVCGRNP